jgi:hypothetical protein
MFSVLFNRERAEAYELSEDVEPEKNYRHTFGGKARHEGTVPPECDRPVHLFYSPNLSDPRIGIRFAERSLKRLPLYYALGNLGGPFRYRVVSGSRIELFCQPYPTKFRAGIMKHYPRPFSSVPVAFTANIYDPNDPRDVWNYGGVLGIGTLTDPQKAALRQRLDEWLREKLDRSLLEGYELATAEGEPEPPLEELVGDYTPFTQGMPQERCPNPACEGHKKKTPLPVLLYLEPDPGDDFYRSIAGGDGGQLIWMVCPKCASVVVENPCT